MCPENLTWNLALLSLVTSTVQKSEVHSVSQCLNVQSQLNELQQFTDLIGFL